MSALAGGDCAALWTLATEFDDELRGAARHRLVRMGRLDLANDGDTLAGLVIDIAFLFRNTSWTPDGGALPWVWAGRAIDRLVSETAGHRSAETDADEVSAAGSDRHAVPGASAGDGVAMSDVGFDSLAESDPTVGLLREAIARVASERDQRVHIAYRTQHADGDPSPANTVAAMTDLAPANVRQIDRRVRAKLSTLVDTDQAFAPLKELAWLA